MSWSFLIYLGLALQVSGFLVREELLLRVLVASGIFCDLLFFPALACRQHHFGFFLAQFEQRLFAFQCGLEIRV